jgi:hypothetical protein
MIGSTLASIQVLHLGQTRLVFAGSVARFMRDTVFSRETFFGFFPWIAVDE